MKNNAFTFVEIMFVLLISGFVSVALCNFMIDSSRALFTSTEKSEIANNIRQFVGEMETVAKASNVAYIYKSFNFADRDTAADRLNDDTSGDCAIFITTEPYYDSTKNAYDYKKAENITKIVVYFRRPDPADPEGKGPVLKLTVPISTPMPTDTYTPESLMAGVAYTGNYPQVLQLSKGLSNGRLFYNYKDKAVMIKAEIIHGNSAKRITNTYNFTVSPKG